MLLDVLFGSGDTMTKILHLLVALMALMPALTFHEWAHGFAAYKLGDSTAKADGRLSLNPLDHIDPIGSLMLLLLGFGWAKPVPVRTRNFKKPRRDFAITSLAGPIANFILAFISAILYSLSVFLVAKNCISGVLAQILPILFMYSTMMNIGLGTFNLIPLPPLDGSNVLICILPNHLASKYAKLRYYTHYIFIGLIILSRLPYPLGMIYDIIFAPLNFIRNLLLEWFFGFGFWLFGLFL